MDCLRLNCILKCCLLLLLATLLIACRSENGSLSDLFSDTPRISELTFSDLPQASINSGQIEVNPATSKTATSITYTSLDSAVTLIVTSSNSTANSVSRVSTTVTKNTNSIIGTTNSEIFPALGLLLALFSFLFLPSIIAIVKNHHEKRAVFLINIFGIVSGNLGIWSTAFNICFKILGDDQRSADIDAGSHTLDESTEKSINWQAISELQFTYKQMFVFLAIIGVITNIVFTKTLPFEPHSIVVQFIKLVIFPCLAVYLIYQTKPDNTPILTIRRIRNRQKNSVFIIGPIIVAAIVSYALYLLPCYPTFLLAPTQPSEQCELLSVREYAKSRPTMRKLDFRIPNSKENLTVAWPKMRLPKSLRTRTMKLIPPATCSLQRKKWIFGSYVLKVNIEQP